MPVRSLVLVAALAIVAAGPGQARAHDLKATVKLLPDAVVVEAGFDDETPAEGAKVVITDAAGKEVASGKTDDRGVCRLPKLEAGKYTAKVESVGHRDEVEFSVAAAASPLDAPIEFARERPNQSIGLAVGVVGLFLAAAAFWWFRLRKSG